MLRTVRRKTAQYVPWQLERPSILYKTGCFQFWLRFVTGFPHLSKTKEISEVIFRLAMRLGFF